VPQVTTSLASFFSFDQLVQILNIYLEALAESGVRKLALPNEFSYSPNRAAKVVCGFG
jgi:hypothetical protein